MTALAHVMCVGAAVLDRSGRLTCAIFIAGPRDRIKPRFADLGDAVRATAREITLRLGCPPNRYATAPDHPVPARPR